MFDTYVNSILCYGSDIWNFHKTQDVEKIHLEFCKKILNVKSTTSNVVVYYELGRYQLSVYRKARTLNYWLKLLNSNNCILSNCYKYWFEQALKCPNKNNGCVQYEMSYVSYSDFPTTMTLFCYQSAEQYKGLTKLLGHLNWPVAIVRFDE